MSNEDRKTLKQECFNVLDYLYKVLKDEDFLHTKGFQNLENDRQRMEIATVFVDVQSYYEESGLFQYNDIYFSIAAAEAAEYAKHANYFGEIGYYTYFFYEGYLLNHKEPLPYEIQKAFNHIEAFSKKKSEPIIMTFCNANTTLCTNEYDDEPFIWCGNYIEQWSEGISIRYKGPVDFGKDCFPLMLENHTKVDSLIKEIMKKISWPI